MLSLLFHDETNEIQYDADALGWLKVVSSEIVRYFTIFEFVSANLEAVPELTLLLII